jgi:hypothetical protein
MIGERELTGRGGVLLFALIRVDYMPLWARYQT